MGDIIVKNGQQYWNNIVNTYTASKPISVDKKCNGYQFTNTGDTIVEVNGMIVYPGVPGVSLGDSRTVILHKNDLYRGNIEIAFRTPLGAAPAVEIVQFVYMQD